MKSKLLPLLAAALLLPQVACTGTDEDLLDLRLVILSDGGRTLGYVSSAADSKTTTSLSRASTLPEPGVEVHQLNAGRQFVLTVPGSLQVRDTNLNQTATFSAPPMEVCYRHTVTNTAQSRLLSLTECSGNQQLTLHRSDGSLVWWAQLPANLVTVPGNDTPPTRLVVESGETALVSRADLTGNSEVIRVTPLNSGDPVRDLQAVVSLPTSTVRIYDLATYGGKVYAATNTGVRPLLPSGLPDTGDSAALTAFGSGRFDRLWSGMVGTRALLAAWRSNLNSGVGTEPLRLWNGSDTSAATVDFFNDLRDLTFGLDGRLYALTRTTLSSYDTVLGLNAQSNWNTKIHLATLNDARAVTWLVDTETP